MKKFGLIVTIAFSLPITAFVEVNPEFIARDQNIFQTWTYKNKNFMCLFFVV